MKVKRRVHDGIAGAILTAGALLAYFVDPLWLLVPGLLGVTLLQSAFTGFCPVYYLLDFVGVPDFHWKMIASSRRGRSRS